jgi:hypothetical protein
MAIKLKEVPAILVRNYLSRTPTVLYSKPAVGKTKTVEHFIEQMKKRIPEFRGWFFYAPTMSPMDIQASAPDVATGMLRLYNNAALPNHYVDPDAKGVIFIDELFNADPATVKLLQKYVNYEDMSGVLRLPEGVVPIAAGNRLEDKSSVQQQGRAFMSRWEQHEVYSDATDNIEYATKHGWHPLVQTFFKDNPSLIDNYDDVFQTGGAAATSTGANKDKLSEEGKRGVWANMRSWERISRKEYAADDIGSPVTLHEAVGSLGSGVGAAYDAHKNVLSKLASFDQIMTDPKGVAVPAKMDEQYALAMIVALRCQQGQMPQVKTFGERLPLELQAVILRNLSIRKNDFNLASADGYVEWVSNPALSKLLNGK